MSAETTGTAVYTIKWVIDEASYQQAVDRLNGFVQAKKAADQAAANATQSAAYGAVPSGGLKYYNPQTGGHERRPGMPGSAGGVDIAQASRELADAIRARAMAERDATAAAKEAAQAKRAGRGTSGQRTNAAPTGMHWARPDSEPAPGPHAAKALGDVAAQQANAGQQAADQQRTNDRRQRQTDQQARHATEQRAEEEPKLAEEIARRRRTEEHANRSTKGGRDVTGGLAGAMGQIGPQQLYYAQAAAGALGMAGPEMLALTAALAMGGVGFGVADLAAKNSQAQQVVSGMTSGGNGATPRPLDQTLLDNLTRIGEKYNVSQGAVLKTLPSLGQYGITDPSTIESAVRIGLTQSKVGQISQSDAVGLGGLMLAQMHLTEPQAKEQLASLQDAVQGLGASPQAVREDILKTGSYLQPGSDLSQFVSVSKAAQPFGVTGSDILQPSLTSTGTTRYTQANLLGVSDQQMIQLQAHPAQLAERLQSYAQSLQKTGMPVDVEQGLLERQGFLQAGPKVNETMQAMLHGDYAGQQNLLNALPTKTPAQLDQEAAAADKAARVAASNAAGPGGNAKIGVQQLQQTMLNDLFGSGAQATQSDPNGAIAHILGDFLKRLANPTAPGSGGTPSNFASTNPNQPIQIQGTFTLKDQSGATLDTITTGASTRTPILGPGVRTPPNVKATPTPLPGR